MGYSLGKHSWAELEQVHPHLVEVVELSISTTPVDFTVHDGIRSRDEQAELVEAGVSFTMRSMHLPGIDGKGRAVDLVPYIGGKLRWDWDPIYVIARVMRESAVSLGRDIRWGGAWDTLLTDPITADPEQMMNMYAMRRHVAQQRVFLDGPHYELVRAQYPDSAT